MKKIYCLLFLGLCTIGLSLPNTADAAEIHPIQENRINIYDSVDEVLTPNIVTLDNGESIEFSKEVFFLPDDRPQISFRVNSVEGYTETFLLEIYSPTCESMVPVKKFCHDYLASASAYIDYRPSKPEVHEIVFKLTNFSAGRTDYNVQYQAINY